MTSILIIEDERPAYENLIRFIKNVSSSYNIVDWLKSVDESIEWFKHNEQPDLIFLDINLSDGSAFEIFSQFRTHIPIIFSTAYDEYAIKAFELNSVDYLLKPIDFNAVRNALNKFEAYHLNTNRYLGNQRQVRLDKALSSIKYLRKNYIESFLVKRGKALIKLPTKNTSYIYFDEATFCVADNGRIYSLNHSLVNIINQLDPQYFFKLNRKVICNISAIRKVKRSLGGKLTVILNQRPEFDVFVSRERAAEFKKWFESAAS